MNNSLQKGVWIDWNQSGECPLPKGAVIHAKDRDGASYENCEVGLSEEIDDEYWTQNTSWYNQIGSYFIVSLPEDVNVIQENRDSQILSLISLIAGIVPEVKAQDAWELANTLITDGWTKQEESK